MITLKPIRDDLVEYEQTLGMQESECRCEDVTMYDDGFLRVQWLRVSVV